MNNWDNTRGLTFKQVTITKLKGKLKMEARMNILGLTRFKTDKGDEFCSVWTLPDSEKKESDDVGKNPVKCKCDWSLMDSVRNETFPAEFNVVGEMVSGSKNNSTFFIESMTPVKPSRPASS